MQKAKYKLARRLVSLLVSGALALTLCPAGAWAGDERGGGY